MRTRFDFGRQKNIQLKATMRPKVGQSRRNSQKLEENGKEEVEKTHNSWTGFSLPAKAANSSMASSRQTVESTSKQTQSHERQMARVISSLCVAMVGEEEDVPLIGEDSPPGNDFRRQTKRRKRRRSE